MKTFLCVGAAVVALALSGVAAQAETLYFAAQPKESGAGLNYDWFSANNWFKPDQQGNIVIHAGRIPAVEDDAWTLTDANAAANGIHIHGLTVGSTTHVSGGDFDLISVQFAPVGVAANSSENGFVNSKVRINGTVGGAMTFVGAGTSLVNTQVIIEPGAFMTWALDGNGHINGVSISGTVLFVQGAIVMPGGAFLGGDPDSRIDLLGELRGSGVTHINGGIPLGMIFNNSGTVRVDSGTILIDGNYRWVSDNGGKGNFMAATDDAVIDIKTLFTVPQGITTTFKGPGTVKTDGAINLLGTLNIGAVDQPTGAIDPGKWEFALLTGQPGGFAGGGTVHVISSGAKQSTINWTTGQITGFNGATFSGAINLDQGSLFNISGPANGDLLSFGGGTINNGGRAAFNSKSTLQFFDPAVFNNLTGAVFEVQSAGNGVLTSGVNSPSQFNNFGTFRKAGGTNTFGLGPTNGAAGGSPRFNNSGTVDVVTGNLMITNGASNGLFQTALGSKIIFTQRPHHLLDGATFIGDGVVELGSVAGSNPGSLAVDGAASMRTFVLGGFGAIDGPGTLTITNAFTWEAGDIKGAGALTLAAGSISAIVGNNPKTFSTRTINNAGSLKWLTDKSIDASENAVFNNLAGGVFDLQTNASMTGTVADTPTFNNAGTFLRSSGNSSTIIGINFNNSGTVRLQTATTSFYNFTQSAGVTDLDGGHMGSVGGTPFTFNGGTLIGSGTIGGGAVINNGATFGPGHSPGLININGDFTQGPNGTLMIEIAGLTTPGVDFDQLAISGTANLGGRLRVVAINGFTPDPSAAVTALTYSALNGTFANTNAQVNYAATSASVAAVATRIAPLLNISTRLRVLTGDNALIGGFIITGNDPKTVIIRAIGPSLADQNISGFLDDPTLELIDSEGASVAVNDGWKQTQESEIQNSGVAPSRDAESAIIRTLNPGAYTAVVRGNNGASGIGVVELYDLAQAANSNLANISSRGFVDMGDNALIGGFILGSGADTRVVVRAIGPSLNETVSGALQDPTLELVDVNGVVVRSNDNWQSDQEAELKGIGIQPSHGNESAILAALPAGSYTAVVRGKENSTGIGVVEVYNVQ